MFQLILFRGIQGLGAGALFPISLAVIGDLFSPQERGKYQGLFGAVFGISALIGPALGGFLTDQISWHWVFYVNLPIGAIALFIIFRLLPAHTESGVTRRIDWLGVFVFSLALVPILIGLTNKQTLDWGDFWVGGLIAIGLAPGRHLHLDRITRGRADRSARALPQPHLHRVDGGRLPGQLRLLRRDHLPAALVPGRRRLVGDRIGLPAAAAAGGPDPELDRQRPDRQPHRVATSG